MTARRWIAFGASAAVAAALGFAPPVERRLDAFRAFALPLLGLAIAAAALAALAAARASWRAGWRPRAEAGVVALALAGAIAVIALEFPLSMRIQSDEFLVGGAALGVRLARVPEVVGSAIVGRDGRVEIERTFVDKRALLLPAAMAPAVAHGWRAAASINLFFGWCALFALYAVLREYVAPAAALTGAWILASRPVFAWDVRSLLSEPLNLALFGACAFVALRAARTRRVDLALLLAALAPLLAQARYESVIPAALALLGAGAFLARAAAPSRAWAALCLVPFLFLPFAWQRAQTFEHGLELIHAADAFSASYVLPHATRALWFLAVPTALNPWAPAFAVAAAIGAVAAARALRGRLAQPDVRAALVTVACVGAVTLVVLAYAWGDLLDSVTSRLGLPLLALYSAMAAAGFAVVTARLRAASGPMQLALGGAALATALPWIADEDSFAWMHTAVPLNRVEAWLDEGYPRCRPLVVSTFAPYFVLNGHSAASVREFTSDWNRWLRPLTTGDVNSVLFVEIRGRDGEATLGERLPPRLLGRLVYDEQMSPDTAVRVNTLNPAAIEPSLPLSPDCP